MQNLFDAGCFFVDLGRIYCNIGQERHKARKPPPDCLWGHWQDWEKRQTERMHEDTKQVLGGSSQLLSG